MSAAAQALAARLASLWSEAREIWIAGGTAMVAIAAISLVLFGLGLRLRLALRRKGFHALREVTWRRWLERPEERRGPVGALLDRVADRSSLAETRALFAELRADETAPFARDLRVMRVCVSAAPLVGLLGTVMGMLATFGALSSGSGDDSMARIAEGISEALITTETGLVIALAGLFFQYRLVRLLEGYKAFLAQLESACAQLLYRRTHPRAERAA